MNTLRIAMVWAALGLAVGCGGGSSMESSLTLSLADSSATVFQGSSQNSVTVNATVGGSATNVAMSVTGLPAGATYQAMLLLAPKTPAGPNWSIVFNSGTAAAGTFSLTVTASSGTLSSTAPFSLTIGAADVVGSTPGAPFSLAMSTAFQPAEWDDAFFTLNAGLNPSPTTTLENLGPSHIRLQGISQGVPQGTAGSASSTWNFSVLDDIVQPVLGVGDHSPEFQIAKAPPFMYTGNQNSGLSNTFTDLTFAQFAGYAQSLVQYYNVPGGFMANGNTYASPSGLPITWWGIYNEPSINNGPLTADQYTTMYNAVVPAMQAVDPSIKFVGLEMCCGSEDWATTFAQGVTAQVDAVASHYYSSCNQADPDTIVMGTIPGFVSSVQTIHTNLSSNLALANVPVWVTENNVNADYSNNGMSACNPGQTFVTDQRGSSPFFAAWRPYVFSQFGKTGIVPILYHWDYDADQQFGEVDYATGGPQLSYWVDYWLGQEFPTTAGAHLLNFTPTDDAELETLPVANGNGSVVIMVANHTVNSTTDNNGPGSPRTVLIDVSALGTFTTGTLLTIDSTTSPTTGPTPAAVTPAPQMTLTLNGYSVAFLTLKP